jgi:hypothetical protein
MNLKKKSNIPSNSSASPSSHLLRHLITAIIVAITLSLSPSINGQTLQLSQPLTLQWTFRSDDISSIGPMADKQSVYLPLTGGAVVSLRTIDGQLDWKTDVGGDILSSLTVDSASVYVASRIEEERGVGATESSVFLRSLSRSSGVILWLRPIPQIIQHTSNSLLGSKLLAVTLENIIIGVDKGTGLIRWSNQLPSRITTAPIFDRETIYLAQEKGNVTVLNYKDGTVARHYQTRLDITSLILGPGGIIFTGTSEGYVNAFSAIEGSLSLNWRKRLSAAIQSLSPTPEGILVVTRDNSVTFLKWQNGKRLWKRRLADRLAAPPTLSEGASLFAPLGEDACTVLSLRDGKEINTLYLGKNNSVVASPLIAGNLLLVPTKHGLLAYTTSDSQ